MMAELVDVPRNVIYRVHTFYETRSGRGGHRTEIFQLIQSVTHSIASANGNARYQYSRGHDVTTFVLAEYLNPETGEWLPIEAVFV
jgi:hypothetical protein